MIPDTIALRLKAAGLALALGVAPVHAGFDEDFVDLLYTGQTKAALDLATLETEAAAGPLAVGTARFLLALEGFGQGLYRHGLQSQYALSEMSMGMSAMPFLRLPVPENPNPEPLTYVALRGLLADFQRDLAVASDALAVVGDAPVNLPLDLGRIRLDFDGDGTGSAAESLLLPFHAVTPRAQTPDAYTVDFDQSDAPWLQGYSHLLQALTGFLLAYDWEPAFDTTLHSLFPATNFASSGLEEELRRARAALQAIIDDQGVPTLPDYPSKPPDISQEEWAEMAPRVYEEFRQSPEVQAFMRYSELQEIGWMADIADLIAFVHLFNWPVADAAQMQQVRLHLLEMIRLSRENWRRIQSETDNGREWVPSPAQTGIFPNMVVDDRRVQGWAMFLDEFEAVLNGDRLVPHWRFVERGINIRRMFDQPRAFDPVLIAQGSAVLPYLESGEMIGKETVGTVMDVFGGGFLAYFLWFN